MGMYYFDVVCTGGATLRDDVGVDLPDIEAAKREACDDGVAIAFQRGHGPNPTLLKIRDEVREVFSVSVQLTVTIIAAGD